MYFVYPSKVRSQLDRALALFADLEWIKVSQLNNSDPNQIYIADVHDFLWHDWSYPTVVIAKSNEGLELSQAWQKGALAGWTWENLPQKPFEHLKAIDAQYKRNQDSRDLPSAAQLQQQLLPRSIDIKNYQFKTIFQPAAYLSGDWYDYWWVDDQQILFYLADVAGHGVTSSLLTSWMAAFHRRADTPQQLIYKLNQMLIHKNVEKHITMIACLLDLNDHTITCCNAGHFPPALYLDEQKNVEILTTSSLPLGLTEDLIVEAITLTMTKNSQFILCSDGALEPYTGGLNEQFQQLITQLQLQQFQPPIHINDDIALLNLTRNG